MESHTDRISIQQSISEFLMDECGLTKAEVAPDEPLFTSGVLASIDIIKIVSLIEEKLGLTIPPLEVSLESFDSVGRIVSFVASKKGL